MLYDTWATVAAGIGGSLIGGLAATAGAYLGLRGAIQTVRYQEREAWRTRLLEAARQFVDAYEAYYANVNRITAPRGSARPTQDEIRAGLVDVATLHTGVLLVFGPRSAAGEAAERMVRGAKDLRAAAFAAISAPAGDRDALHQRLNGKLKALVEEGAEAAFADRVHEAIRPPIVGQ